MLVAEVLVATSVDDVLVTDSDVEIDPVVLAVAVAAGRALQR